MINSWNRAGLYRWIVLLACLTFGLALASYAYTGTFARYWADDYCYNAVLRADGFWKAQLSFYQTTSDRYSVIPLVGISELFGRQAIRFWPLLAIVLSLASLTWTLKQLAVSLGLTLRFSERLLVAMMVNFFSFWQAPDLFQGLYWRTGMLTYFMPLVVDVFLAGLILKYACQARPSLLRLGIVFALAFFAGGFSETTTAMQAGGVGLALVAVGGMAWVAGRKASAARSLVRVIFERASTRLLLAALTGTLLAMVVLVVSPSVRLRMTHMPESASLPVLLVDSFRFSFDFIKDTFTSQPLPTLISLLAAFSLALAWQGLRSAEPGWRNPLTGILASALVTYLLIACVCAPSVYVEVAYPEPRALTAARFCMVLGLVASGWFFGLLAAQAASKMRFPPAWVWLGGLLLLALLALYPLRSSRVILGSDLAYFQSRAAGWDVRDQLIREQVAQGKTRLTVVALDSIARLMELQPDGAIWPNTCVAGMYGLQEIRGVNP